MGWVFLVKIRHAKLKLELCFRTANRCIYYGSAKLISSGKYQDKLDNHSTGKERRMACIQRLHAREIRKNICVKGMKYIGVFLPDRFFGGGELSFLHTYVNAVGYIILDSTYCITPTFHHPIHLRKLLRV